MFQRIIFMFSFFSLCSIANALAQVPSIQWEECFGGSDGDNCWAMCQSQDGAYVIGGISRSNDSDLAGQNIGNFDVWLLKIDSADGSIIWQYNLGGTEYDNCNAIIQTLDGGYILTGETKSTSIPGSHGGLHYDAYVCKVDNLGNLQWHRSYGGTLDDGGYGIIQNSDSSYIIAGYTSSNNGDVSNQIGGYDYRVFKIDASGNIIWEKTFGGSQYDNAWSIVLTSSGQYVVSGASRSNDINVSGNHGDSD